MDCTLAFILEYQKYKILVEYVRSKNINIYIQNALLGNK